MTEPEQITEAEQLAVPVWMHRLASKIVLGNHGVGNAGVLIQRAFEERERAGYDRALAVLGEALDHLLQDVELEDALTAVGISVYGPDATKFEKMFAAAMKCRARFVALATRQDAPVTENSDDH